MAFLEGMISTFTWPRHESMSRANLKSRKGRRKERKGYHKLHLRVMLRASEGGSRSDQLYS